MGLGAATAAGLGGRLWLAGDEQGQRAEVVIARADAYDDRLADVIERVDRAGTRSGLGRGKSVLLKPNLVEPSRDAPHVNTHPAVVRAAAEVFRRRGRAR